MFDLPPEIKDTILPYMYPRIASCIVHCNEQIVYDQKSWKDLASDNRTTIITLVACSTIAVIAIPIAKLTVFVAVPMLYMLIKTRSLECKANSTLLESQLFFNDIFLKNTELHAGYNVQYADKILSFSSKLIKNTSISERELKEARGVVWKYSIENGNQCWLGSLARVAFLQVIKDYKYAWGMKRQKNACSIGIYSVFFAATTFFFISSKIRIIVSAIFSGISLCAAKKSFGIYKVYSKDSKIEEKTLRTLLLILHRKLAVPKELCAY